jgi:hypothetical protein
MAAQPQVGFLGCARKRARPAGPADRPSSTISLVVGRQRRPIDGRSSGQTDSYVAKRGRPSPRLGSRTKDDQGGKQGERQDHRTPALTCGLEPEVGFEPTTFRLRVEEPSSSRYRPDPSWLLTSAGSSVECAPDLPSYGRGNDRENDQDASAGSPACPCRRPDRWLGMIDDRSSPSDRKSDGKASSSRPDVAGARTATAPGPRTGAAWGYPCPPGPPHHHLVSPMATARPGGGYALIWRRPG